MEAQCVCGERRSMDAVLFDVVEGKRGTRLYRWGVPAAGGLIRMEKEGERCCIGKFTTRDLAVGFGETVAHSERRSAHFHHIQTPACREKLAA